MNHTKPPHNPWATLYFHDLGISVEYLTATPAQRGVWFGVLMRAIYNNDGPLIRGAALYDKRQCMAAFGCTPAELRRPNPLIWVDEPHVKVLFGYPDDERFRQIRKRDSDTERKRRYRMKLASEGSQ